MRKLISIVFVAAIVSGCSTVCIPVEGHDHNAKSRDSNEKVCTFGWRVNSH